MSGLVAWWDREGRPVDRAALAGMARAQAHRGPEGFRTLVDGPLGMVHQHFPTTPEEAGEAQPLECGGLVVALDGFFTNREALTAALGREHRGLSDAALLALAYRRWGPDCAAHLDGAFAFVLWDAAARRLVLARDALGLGPLVWTEVGGLVVAASEEGALLAHPAVSRTLDEGTMARYFAIEPPAPGRTFFEGIRQVEAGSLLRVEARGIWRERHWRPDPERRLACAGDREYAEALREALDEAVAGCLRSPQRASVLMSGGFDSTAVAGVAASLGADPLAVTWTFDTLPGADEREEAAAMARHNGLEHLLVPSDDCAPSPGAARRAVAPDTPLVNPFRPLLDRAYTAAREAAGPVVLLGWFADDHYAARHRWLAEMLRDRGVVAAVAELGRVWRYQPPWRREGFAPLRHLAGRMLSLRLRRRRRLPPPWLTARAAARLREELQLETPPPGDAQARLSAALPPHLAEVVAGEQRATHRLGVEARYPFATRRVFETLLAMPAYLLTRGAFLKFVQALAVRRELPERLVAARPKKHLGTLYRKGMPELLAALSADGETGGGSWAGWIDPGWMERLTRGPGGAVREREALLPWRVLTWEAWRLEGRGRAVAGSDRSVA